MQTINIHEARTQFWREVPDDFDRMRYRGPVRKV